MISSTRNFFQTVTYWGKRFSNYLTRFSMRICACWWNIPWYSCSCTQSTRDLGLSTRLTSWCCFLTNKVSPWTSWTSSCWNFPNFLIMVYLKHFTEFSWRDIFSEKVYYPKTNLPSLWILFFFREKIIPHHSIHCFCQIDLQWINLHLSRSNVDKPLS